jgi:hypothetical protein
MKALFPTSLPAAVVCALTAILATSRESIADDRVLPYPPSPVIAEVVWDWKTHRTAAPGSDLWPVAVGADDALYTAWGDGGGFDGTDREGRVAMGFARITGPPEDFHAVNLNGGVAAAHIASFPDHGKTGGLLAVGPRLYAWFNMQNGKWPDVDHALIWSDDNAATWHRSEWVFARGNGKLKPATFANFGRGTTGMPQEVAGYVYCYGQRQGDETHTFLGRAPQDAVEDLERYEFFAGLADGRATWSDDPKAAKPVFTDTNGTGDLTSVVYMPALRRYLLSNFHKGPGQLGLFDGPQPWGPWTTAYYAEAWGEMGAEGSGLACSFPKNWMSADGRTLWCIFSVYGEGAKQGVQAHDKFNLVKATLRLRAEPRR